MGRMGAGYHEHRGRALTKETEGFLCQGAIGLAILGYAMVFGAAGALAQAPEKERTYETVFYPSGKLEIEAYVFKPQGAGPFPVVVYNHGSRAGHEREERPFAYVGELLAGSGYLVLVPERRGYG